MMKSSPMLNLMKQFGGKQPEQNAETYDIDEVFPALPYVGLRGVAPISTVPNEAGRHPALEKDVTPDDLQNLHYVRHLFPFVPIVPFPSKIVTVVLDGVNPSPIKVPSETVVVRFRTSGGIYIAASGNAHVPSVATPDVYSLLDPDDYFYVRGLLHFSAISDRAGTVQIMCWAMSHSRKET